MIWKNLKRWEWPINDGVSEENRWSRKLVDQNVGWRHRHPCGRRGAVRRRMLLVQNAIDGRWVVVSIDGMEEHELGRIVVRINHCRRWMMVNLLGCHVVNEVKVGMSVRLRWRQRWLIDWSQIDNGFRNFLLFQFAFFLSIIVTNHQVLLKLIWHVIGWKCAKSESNDNTDD